MSTAKLASTAGAFANFLMILLYALIGISVVLLCWYLLSFKHLVRVRQATASGYVIIDTKAREFTTRDGMKKWRLLKWIKQTVTAPEVDYLEFTKKGKFSAEADRSANGDLNWRKRSGDPNLKDVFTSEERLITATEMRRANDYLNKGIMDKILAMAPAMMCIIIVVLVFTFWGKFVETTSNAASQAAVASERLADAMSIQNDILSKCEGNINWTKYQVVVDNKGQKLPLIPN